MSTLSKVLIIIVTITIVIMTIITIIVIRRKTSFRQLTRCILAEKDKYSSWLLGKQEAT